MPDRRQNNRFRRYEGRGQSCRMPCYRQYKRTVPMQKAKEIGTVFLFCLLLPYVIATLTGRAGHSRGADIGRQQTVFVVCRDAGGTERIPLNTFLAGALAASIDTGMMDETLKAQAVLLRSTVMEAYGRKGDKGSGSVAMEDVGLKYYDVSRLRRIWAEGFEANYGKLMQIVEETDGIIIAYHGIPVQAPYFYASAGRTRAGSEVYTEGEYPYLLPVESLQDFNCEDYAGSILFPRHYFREKMIQLFGLAEESRPELSDFVLQKDSSGYVCTVVYKGKDSGEGEVIPGDYVKDALELKSTHFAWEESKEGILVQVQGVGHGLGFSQYGANEMAKKGDTYDALLKYYFHDIEIQKY